MAEEGCTLFSYIFLATPSVLILVIGDIRISSSSIRFLRLQLWMLEVALLISVI
jgi:hypothetical protein